MENDIRSYSDELNLERKKFIRVEKELASCKNLKEKVCRVCPFGFFN